MVRKVADKVQHSRPLKFRPILLCKVRETLSGRGIWRSEAGGEMGVDLYA